MDKQKFCFIICSNNELYLNEFYEYLQYIQVPEGYSAECLSIEDAISMTSGYNEGMMSSNAKYKIYIHHDVYILNRCILYDILKIFKSDENIGMIGMVGSEHLPCDGVMWHGYRVGNFYGEQELLENYKDNHYDISEGLWDVQAIDGFFMATSKDLPWREDLFDGWDFYDISHSIEMKKKGYRVVVPEQKYPWCLHDDGILNLLNYNKYRKIFLQEYKEIL